MALPHTGEADPMITLAENRYGKSRVRVVKVKRHPDRHDFREWAVEILVGGDLVLTGPQPADLSGASHAIGKYVGASSRGWKAASDYLCTIGQRASDCR